MLFGKLALVLALVPLFFGKLALVPRRALVQPEFAFPPEQKGRNIWDYLQMSWLSNLSPLLEKSSKHINTINSRVMMTTSDDIGWWSCEDFFSLKVFMFHNHTFHYCSSHTWKRSIWKSSKKYFHHNSMRWELYSGCNCFVLSIEVKIVF